jgi:hypothetical protein
MVVPGGLLGDERYLDPVLAGDKAVCRLAAASGAKSFSLSSLVRLRCAGKDGRARTRHTERVGGEHPPGQRARKHQHAADKCRHRRTPVGGALFLPRWVKSSRASCPTITADPQKNRPESRQRGERGKSATTGSERAHERAKNKCFAQSMASATAVRWHCHLRARRLANQLSCSWW